ncbi:10939_t:CDS:2 [Ambispora leptoticha]|uniref:10939_t:CDS:1 n=1 Tax=Ambispora leptoticha TaxID=144679 RepID=A0A9N9BYN6_9GLOM|nr:10939_t:CDS:2 [Ambispora leptoticha]
MGFPTFPLLCPLDEDGLCYRGFLTFQDQEFLIGIELTRNDNNNNSLKNTQLYFCEELKRLAATHINTIKQLLEQHSDLESFLIDLKELLVERLVTKKQSEPLPSPEYCSFLIAELDSVGWDKLESIDHSLKEVTLKLSDSSGRQHSIFVSFPPNYPKTAAAVRADLPTSYSVPQSYKTRLKDIVLFFLMEFEKYEDFWYLVEDIDRHTWVLDPAKPKRNDLTRRIFLGNHCSLLIKWKIEDPRSMCKWQLFGAEKFAAPLRQNLNKISKIWNKNITTRENFENILGFKFPSPQNTSQSDFEIDCAICYIYEIEDGSIPDQSCNNLKCGQSFHKSCILEWKKQLQEINSLYTKCPYCNEGLIFHGSGR